MLKSQIIFHEALSRLASNLDCNFYNSARDFLLLHLFKRFVLCTINFSCITQRSQFPAIFFSEEETTQKSNNCIMLETSFILFGLCNREQGKKKKFINKIYSLLPCIILPELRKNCEWKRFSTLEGIIGGQQRAQSSQPLDKYAFCLDHCIVNDLIKRWTKFTPFMQFILLFATSSN